LVLTLLPFEAAFYEEHDVPACFVGHPLADLIPLQADKLQARKNLQLEADTTYVALLPGSRRNEIRFLAESFILAAEKIWQEKPTVKFITSAANTARDQEFRAHCQQLAPHLPITFFVGSSHAVMESADVVLVTSGTATLETMLFKRPMVIAYRMANLTYQIARHLVKIPHIGLPNLLANERLVPEFIQDAVTPENLATAVLDFLDHPQKMENLEAHFQKIHEQLRCNANQRAATAVLNLLKSRK
jgi:lipid-A-disaccharide synthase